MENEYIMPERKFHLIFGTIWPLLLSGISWLAIVGTESLSINLFWPIQIVLFTVAESFIFFPFYLLLVALPALLIMYKKSEANAKRFIFIAPLILALIAKIVTVFSDPIKEKFEMTILLEGGLLFAFMILIVGYLNIATYFAFLKFSKSKLWIANHDPTKPL